MQRYDVIVIGAGAAGLMCAAHAGQGGLRVALMDHSEKLAEKIRISGGGRCNFTNREVSEKNFVSEDGFFAQFALGQYTPADFIALVKRHKIPFHEKHKGQLFCDRKSDDIINMLVVECEAGKVKWYRPHSVNAIEHDGSQFKLSTTAGSLLARKLVVATGGLSVPKIGATDFGLRVAKQFGHTLVDQRPALVPLVFDPVHWGAFVDLAGISLPVRIRGSESGAPAFDEDLLFTHRGLSGPAILQASTYWTSGKSIVLNLSGKDCCNDAFQRILFKAAQGVKSNVDQWFAAQVTHWPRRLVKAWLSKPELQVIAGRRVAEIGNKHLTPLVQSLVNWQLAPCGTEGYKKAEVMRGGVSTFDLKPKTLESRRLAGLYFIGEVVDVTGWLGGYNFQWAWSSGYAAAQALLSEN
jgi:predicted Rossmann fold flavoprotein